jgi:hypothetical protein
VGAAHECRYLFAAHSVIEQGDHGALLQRECPEQKQNVLLLFEEDAEAGSFCRLERGFVQGMNCGQMRASFQYVRTATVRTQASGSWMVSHCLHAKTMASRVASSASALLALVAMSRATVLLNRSRRNESKSLPVT